MVSQALPNDGANISVVMITLNEERAVAKVVGDIRNVVPQAEIVVVDSSKDRTAEIAQELGCVVVKQYPPIGYGPAMDKALTTASRDVVITLDCDDTYPVEDIRTLAAMMSEGWDLISASRLPKKPDAMPLSNYIANVVFAQLAMVLCGIKSTDVHTGMRAYRKKLIHDFPYQPKGPALPVELQAGPAAVGYRCVEIFIDYKPRIGESKLKKIESTIWTVKRLWRWRWFFNSERAMVSKSLDKSSAQVS